MPASIASLPMYDIDRAAVRAWWAGLSRALRDAGLENVPTDLSWPVDLARHWRSPDLLLSQTCGLPLVSELLDHGVQVVGALRYDARGCHGIEYSSVLVTRRTRPGRELADFRGATVAYNDAGSHSGFNALRALILPLRRNGRFFGSALRTGSHRRSIARVREGAADLAAIDCVTYALISRAHPEELEGLQVLTRTASAPGLPLITSASTRAADVDRLRRALRAAVDDPALAPARSALLIDGFEPTPVEAWQAIGLIRKLAEQDECYEL